MIAITLFFLLAMLTIKSWFSGWSRCWARGCWCWLDIMLCRFLLVCQQHIIFMTIWFLYCIEIKIMLKDCNITNQLYIILGTPLIISFLFSRYVLYGVIILESLALPLLTTIDSYAEVEYLKFSLIFAPVALLVSASGLLFFKFNKQRDYYKGLFFGGFLISTLAAICFMLFYKSFIITAPFWCYLQHYF